MFKVNIFIILSGLLLSCINSRCAWAEGATAIGTAVNTVGNNIQTISGQVTLPTGSFVGPVIFTPGTPPTGQNIIDNLVISPGGINLSSGPATLSSAAAATLSGLNPNTQLSDVISIIRSGQEYLNNSNPTQAVATGSTTLTNTTNGLIQTVSGSISLPNGLYFQGSTATGCAAGTGCLVITPTIGVIKYGDGSSSSDLGITKLQIDPGTPALINPQVNFNVVAAKTLYSTNSLDGQVSIIRAAGGVSDYSSNNQAIATGSSTVTTNIGYTQSVTGSLSLPVGFYFSSSTALSINPNLIYNDATVGADSAYIQKLTILPGTVLPNANTLTGTLAPLDFNQAAAAILYKYIDSQTNNSRNLSEIVSILRAGYITTGGNSTTHAQAIATGSITVTLPNKASQSITGSISLPNGVPFAGSSDSSCSGGASCLVITPTFSNLPTDGSNPNTVIVNSLKTDGGNASTNRVWTFDAAAAHALEQAQDLQEQTSIIRAGSNGLE